MNRFLAVLILVTLPFTVHAKDLSDGLLVLKSETWKLLKEQRSFSLDEKISFTLYYRGDYKNGERKGGRVAVGYLAPRKKALLSPGAAFNLGVNAPEIELFKGILTRNKRPGYSVAASLLNNTFQVNFNDERNVYSATIDLNQHKSNGRYRAEIKKVQPFIKIDGDEIIPTFPAEAEDDTGDSPSTLSAEGQISTYTIEVSTVTDPEFVNIKGSSSLANSTILSVINTAETIYNNQASITFSVVNQVVTDSTVFTTNDPTTLLTQLTNYGNNVDTSSRDIGHLFTGRNLTGTTIGLAFLGVVCKSPTFSYGLTQMRNNESLAGLTFAHEVGHNLGASHDSSTNSLMSPTINPALNTFSSFSLNEISTYLNQGSNSLCVLSSDSGSGSSSYSIGKIKVKKSGAFRITINQNSDDVTSCTVSLYAGENNSKLSQSNIDSKGVLISEVSGSLGSVVLKTTCMANKLSKDSSVKFRLKISCDDGDTFSEIKSKTLWGGGSQGKKSWLNTLKNATFTTIQK